MTLYQFSVLSEDEKTALVWNEGDFVADRWERNCYILLYQVFSFYVEIWYERDLNQIKKLRSFNSTNQLKPYLEEINISEIIQ